MADKYDEPCTVPKINAYRDKFKVGDRIRVPKKDPEDEEIKSKHSTTIKLPQTSVMTRIKHIAPFVCVTDNGHFRWSLLFIYNVLKGKT